MAEEELLDVIKSYLNLESKSSVKLCAQIMSTLKCLSHIPDSFLRTAIDFIDKTEFDQSVGRVLQKIEKKNFYRKLSTNKLSIKKFIWKIAVDGCENRQKFVGDSENFHHFWTIREFFFD